MGFFVLYSNYLILFLFLFFSLPFVIEFIFIVIYNMNWRFWKKESSVRRCNIRHAWMQIIGNYNKNWSTHINRTSNNGSCNMLSRRVSQLKVATILYGFYGTQAILRHRNVSCCFFSFSLSLTLLNSGTFLWLLMIDFNTYN